MAQVTLDELLLSNRPPAKYDEIPTDWIAVAPGLNPTEALQESVRAHGVLQPILVNRMADGKYECITGARRVRAARTCGLAKVPAMVLALPEHAGALLSLPIIENKIRADNVGMASQHVAALFELGADEDMLTGALNLSKTKVRSMRAVWVDLIEAFHEPFVLGSIRSGVARSVSRLTIPQQRTAYELYEQNGKLSAADVARIKAAGVSDQPELPGIETGEDSWKPKARTAALTLELAIRAGAKENTSAAELLARLLSLLEEYGLRGFDKDEDEADDDAPDEQLTFPEPEPERADGPPLADFGSPDDPDAPVFATLIPPGLSVDDVLPDPPKPKRSRKPATTE